MRKFAKLMIFFSLTFALFFFFAILFGFLSFWVNSVSNISAEARFGQDFSQVAWTATSVALYFSILLSLSYSAIQKIAAPLSILSIAALALVFTSASSLGSRRLEALGPAFTPISPIQAGPGLILSRFENSIVLLKESSETLGPRLVSIPDLPLIYQEVPLGPNNTVLSLPPLPFANTIPWFIQSIGLDFSLNAVNLRTLFERNFLSFVIYALSLILLLSSFRFLLEFSHWTLANIFLAAFVFRLILSFEIFLNSAETNAIVVSFLADRLPYTFITPTAFVAITLLVMLYTILTRLARSGVRKSKRDLDD